jgi:hypothetical protein
VNVTSFDFKVGALQTTGLVYRPEASRATLVLAHGAGGRQRTPFMVRVAEAVASRGLDVVTFDFLYAHAGRRVPDKSAVLEATWLAAVDAVRSQTDGTHDHLFIGGKSMGGRIATEVAAHDDAGTFAGVVLLGYPLHPPGKPERLRAAHLPHIKAPLLFVQGSRDVFGTPDEIAPFLPALPSGSRLFVIEGGDHSLAVPKKGGQTPQSIMARVADEIVAFCAPGAANHSSVDASPGKTS